MSSQGGVAAWDCAVANKAASSKVLCILVQHQLFFSLLHISVILCPLIWHHPVCVQSQAQHSAAQSSHQFRPHGSEVLFRTQGMEAPNTQHYECRSHGGGVLQTDSDAGCVPAMEKRRGTEEAAHACELQHPPQTIMHLISEP